MKKIFLLFATSSLMISLTSVKTNAMNTPSAPSSTITRTIYSPTAGGIVVKGDSYIWVYNGTTYHPTANGVFFTGGQIRPGHNR